MKFLVDENLAPRLANDLADLFPGSIHVAPPNWAALPMLFCGITRRRISFTFLTKDKDFASLSITLGAPPKVILLLTGNCSTATIERIVRQNAVRLAEFASDAKRSLLILK